MEKIKVSAIYTYPIKSCAGLSHSNCNISHTGLENDRRFMLINAQNEAVTQRKYKKLALVSITQTHSTLTLTAPNLPMLHFSVNEADGTNTLFARIWDDTVSVNPFPEKVNHWFSQWLGFSVKLVAMAPNFKRELDPDFRINISDHTLFADGYPFLLISQASLNDLNNRLEQPLPMNRFRPNIVVEGCDPYEEDNWKEIKIGGVRFSIVKPCARCVLTTIDQTTLEQTKEPLATLATYRRDKKGKVLFGQNLIHHGKGILKLGDKVEIIKTV